MRSFVMVVASPCVEDTFRMIEREKLMHVQALIAQAAVEGLEVSVVGRLAGPREVELHAAIERPRFHRF